MSSYTPNSTHRIIWHRANREQSTRIEEVLSVNIPMDDSEILDSSGWYEFSDGIGFTWNEEVEKCISDLHHEFPFVCWRFAYQTWVVEDERFYPSEIEQNYDTKTN